jgi:hypothetical protein
MKKTLKSIKQLHSFHPSAPLEHHMHGRFDQAFFIVKSTYDTFVHDVMPKVMFACTQPL